MGAHMAYEDVCGFQISMKHALSVEPRKRLQEPAQQTGHLSIGGQVHEPLIEGHSCHEVGTQVEDPVGDSEIVHPDNTGMTKALKEGEFLSNPASFLKVLPVDELQRHLMTAEDVPCGDHAPHSTRAQKPLWPVPVSQ